ncbi:TRF2-interacting telomeric protein/Rap1 C terminal domain-containing protein [Mariannaea sp. PMI_226]|nr:TRF2-interacting telomeric protein/Rap1 C terminal domain-containing protein [Mariannaea sp. PMI_226]
MGAVTYDGVESTEGGDIFKGIHFWLSQRVPMRKTLEDQIRANGGILVPLEKRADILIADHAKAKSAPSGSYSWRFIEDSIKNGYIQIKDRYLIGLDPTLPRPAGGGGATKGTRTAFTAAEDAALAKWVLAHPNRTGNKIFQEFEAINPRHPWQSWRNRFVKSLQLLPMPKLQQLADSAPEQLSSSPQKQVPPPLGKQAQEQEENSRLVSVENNIAPEVEPSSPRQNAPEPGTRPVRNIDHKKAQASTEGRSQGKPLSEDGGTDSVDPTESAKMIFYGDLKEYIAATGDEINLRPRIDEVEIDLFDLYVAVQTVQAEDSQGLDELDWAKVADFLGFDPDDEATAGQVCQCYETHLANFEEAMADFNDGNDDRLEGEMDANFAMEAGLEEPQPATVAPSDPFWNEPEATKLQEGQWEEESPSRQSPHRSQPSYVRSSPPVRVKRTIDQVPLVSSGPMRKRSRFGKKAEIPSTPDMDRGGRRTPSTQYLSPSIRKSLMRQDYVDASEASQHLPPLPPVEDESLGGEEEGEEDDDQEGHRPAESTHVLDTQLSPPRHTPQPSPLLGTGDNPTGITPSQQLHTEISNSTPVPFTLSKARQQKNPSTSRRNLTHPVQEVGLASSNHHRESGSTQPAASKPATASTTNKGQKAPRRSLPRSFTIDSQPLSQPADPTSSAKTRISAQPTPTDSNQRDIDQWIKHYESLGFPRPIVIEGLTRTTLTPGSLAELVMGKLQKGEEIPSHHEGIWTDRDDDELIRLNAVDLRQEPVGELEKQKYRKARKALKRLVYKHGEEGMELRKTFLEAQGATEQHNWRG